LDWLRDFLPQLIEENHSVLVFSQFTKLLDEIEDWLEEEDVAYKRLDGSTSATNRRKAVADFGKDKAEVFLLSLKAGGVGLNLTQASYVVIMDPWWNPAVEAQAIDRAHRMGQKKPVTVYRPIIRGSLEERILRLQQQKKQLFATLVGTETDMVLDKLKPEDIFELLK
jgi:SNF2 family DNA or RNA helicase